MGINRGMPLVIIGAGGFGREVKWLVERINQRDMEQTGHTKFNLIGFLDDGIKPGTYIAGLPVLGGIEWLEEQETELNLVCAVGAAKVREKIIRRIEGFKAYDQFSFPVICDPSVLFDNDLCLGRGCIICAGTILTVNVQIGEFSIINLACTIGHDAVLEPFVTLYPGVNLSGCVTVGKRTELGPGSCVIQGISIEENVIVGAGAVVIRELPKGCTAVGSPARPIKFG